MGMSLLPYIYQVLYQRVQSVNDTTVPFATAAIESSDPFAGHEPADIFMWALSSSRFPCLTLFVNREMEPGYKPIVKNYKFADSQTKAAKPFFYLDFGRFSPSRVLPPVLNLRFPFNFVRLQHL